MPHSSVRFSLRHGLAPLLVLALVAVAGCGSPGPDDAPEAMAPTAPTGPPPDSIASGPPAADVDAAAAELFVEPLAPPPASALEVIGASDDLRFAWYLADRLRYEPTADDAARLVAGLAALTGVDAPAHGDPWIHFVDLLLAWDVPPPPDYLVRKQALHLAHDPSTAAFFDAEAALDWRQVTASGTARDEVAPLDDPEVVEVGAGGSWLSGDDAIFGVHVDGEWRVYPRHVLRAHEIVNDTVGHRRIVVTYCEPCGSATAWYADGYGEQVPGEDGISALDFGSSGLVLAGTPLAYDEATSSLFDTFAGRAVTGPLAERAVTLEPITVVASTWTDWAAAHEGSSLVAEDGGVGRIYLDEQTPQTTIVWPVGQRDDRLDGAQTVLGVHLPDGTKVAFPVDAVRRSLADDGEVRWAGVDLTVDAGGLVALTPDSGAMVPSHESSWRSWSRFHPDTQLWEPGS